MLVAQVNDKWFVVNSIITPDDKEIRTAETCLFLAAGHGVVSGIVEMSQVQKIKAYVDEAIDVSIH